MTIRLGGRKGNGADKPAPGSLWLQMLTPMPQPELGPSSSQRGLVLAKE
jgi:hypothetical protein